MFQAAGGLLIALSGREQIPCFPRVVPGCALLWVFDHGARPSSLYQGVPLRCSREFLSAAVVYAALVLTPTTQPPPREEMVASIPVPVPVQRSYL